MEQITSLRAQAEVEKALMLKRSSLGSVDDRRPSYVMHVLEDLAEVEEGKRCALLKRLSALWSQALIVISSEQALPAK